MCGGSLGGVYACIWREGDVRGETACALSLARPQQPSSRERASRRARPIPGTGEGRSAALTHEHDDDNYVLTNYLTKTMRLCGQAVLVAALAAGWIGLAARLWSISAEIHCDAIWHFSTCTCTV